MWQLRPTSAHRTLAQDSATRQLSATVSRSAASSPTAGLEVWPRNRVSSGPVKVACRAIAGPLRQVSHILIAELMLIRLTGGNPGRMTDGAWSAGYQVRHAGHRWALAVTGMQEKCMRVLTKQSAALRLDKTRQDKTGRSLTSSPTALRHLRRRGSRVLRMALPSEPRVSFWGSLQLQLLLKLQDMPLSCKPSPCMCPRKVRILAILRHLANMSVCYCAYPWPGPKVSVCHHAVQTSVLHCHSPRPRMNTSSP